VVPVSAAAPAPQKPLQQDPSQELKIGIVQRFGEMAQDTLTISALPGDQLTVRFQTEGQTQTVKLPSLKLETSMQPLAQPRIDERIVFSEHRSFETAEEQARQWQDQGIAVEVAQPERWQVWAKRSVYKTPLVRRLLLQSLQQKGIQNVRLESKKLTQVPRSSFVVGNFRYVRDRLEITSGRGVVQVDRQKDAYPQHTYPGTLRLQPNAYGTTTLVNLVPLETYLRGVVPYEIGQKAPFQAMAAQAILARTYVLRNTRRFSVDDYQLCATTQCQVYYGLDGTTAATDRAIALTQEQVLTYNNELVDALYSSTTGGVTAAFTDVWRGTERPYLRVRLDAISTVWNMGQQPLKDEQNFRTFLNLNQGFNESETSSWFRWKNEASLQAMNKQLRQYLQSIQHPLANFKTIQNVQVMQRSTGGRVTQLGIATDRGSLRLERDEILLALEAPNSLLFYVDPVFEANPAKTLKGFRFTGGGLGHAVGLSQYGSYHLAKLGWNYDQILQFYFPGTQLEPINSKIVAYRAPALSQSGLAQF
jgi:SpoIID/LytB domain protein